jgi:hypothetical protein
MGNGVVDGSALSRRTRSLSSQRAVSMITGDVATVVGRPRQARQHPVEYDKIGRRVEARFSLVAAIDMLGEPCRVDGRTGLSRDRI